MIFVFARELCRPLQKSAKRKRALIPRAILEWDREKERHTKKSQQGKEVKTVARTEDIKITALYERLSRDDEQVGESNSIQNHDVMYRGWNTPKNITS